MKYIFGPVPSRRLGKSLGIDPIPLKTCNWNCVYCQLGRTAPLTTGRSEYAPRQDILVEVQQALAAQQSGEIDWVTFVGSGEPTLHSGLGWLIRQVKALTDIPVAVITNGSLLYYQEVREELSFADAVMPSLDAGSAWLYRRINRPSPQFSFDRLIEGLKIFRQVYSAQLWVEVMLIKGMNDTEEALREIAAALIDIQPHQIHLLLPVRPPAESWVQPSDESGLQRAQATLGAVAHTVTLALVQETARSMDDLEPAILGIIARHPMQEEELCGVLGRWSLDEVHRTLDILQAVQKAQVIERYGKRFWSVAGARFSQSNLSAEPKRKISP